MEPDWKHWVSMVTCGLQSILIRNSVQQKLVVNRRMNFVCLHRQTQADEWCTCDQCPIDGTGKKCCWETLDSIQISDVLPTGSIFDKFVCNRQC